MGIAPINAGRPQASVGAGLPLLLDSVPPEPRVYYLPWDTTLSPAWKTLVTWQYADDIASPPPSYSGTLHTSLGLSGVATQTAAPVVPVPVVTFTANPAVSLGCGEYQVLFVPKGGGNAIGSLPFTSLDWSRALDSTTDATFVLTGLTGGSKRRQACCGVLAQVAPWRSELWLVRDDELVWAGPVTQVKVQGEVATVAARDLSQWLYRRRLREDHSYTSTDLAVIFEAYVADAMRLDPSPNLSVTTTPCGVLGTRSVLALQHVMCGDQIDELTQTGIDWTVVGREMLAGGAVVPTRLFATPPLLIDDSFATPPEVVLDGLQMATDWLVRGAGGGDGPDTIYGEAGGLSGAYGLVEQVVSQDAILDAPSATAAATSLVSLAGQPIALISDGVLSPRAGVPMSDLIPGVVFSVALSEACLQVQQGLRLAGISVSVQPGQDEQVTVSFQPEGTTQ